MKTFKSIAALTCVALSLVLASCTIDENINNSPNAINEDAIKTVDGLNALLVGLQTASGDFYSGDRSRINTFFAWQMCSPEGLGRPQPTFWDHYILTEDGPPNDNWLFGYRSIKIADDIIRIAPGVDVGGEPARNTYLGIAKAYRGMLIGELAAMYGSIPIKIDGLTAPDFVNITAAYGEAQRLFDEALGHFGSTAGNVRDLNYGGDGGAWRETVHSLKARYCLHLKVYDKALAEARQGISSPDGNLYAIYTLTPDEYSPWGYWTQSEAGEPIRVEKTFMDLLKSDSGDTRLSEYFNPNEDGQYIGHARHGEAISDSAELDAVKTSTMKKYHDYDKPFPIISYEETQLIIAECEARLGNLGAALDAINIIRSAAGLSNFTSADQAAVIAEALKQKNIQLFLEGQAYYDMRRTGSLPEPTVPKRWIYPQSEKNANPHVPADDDGLMTPVLP